MGFCRFLLLCTLLCCSIQVQAQDAAQGQYKCDAISDIPEPLRCNFVRTECEPDSRVPYAEWYYCGVAPHGWFAKALFVAALLCLLPLLFTALGDTAELYFSPTMALVAQTIPGVRPRFAGVTFVAVGNGAPDLSANISALRGGQVALSAGAFTGAAMFVQCVVASEVIRISGGVKCRGATLRDVGVYAVSIIGVCLALHSGTVTRWFVAGTVLVYVLYATWVFLGDEWHARGRPELRPGLGMSWGDLRALLLERQNAQLQHRHSHHQPVQGYKQPAVTGEGEGMTQPLLPWASLDLNPSMDLNSNPSPLPYAPHEVVVAVTPPTSSPTTWHVPVEVTDTEETSHGLVSFPVTPASAAPFSHSPEPRGSDRVTGVTAGRRRRSHQGDAGHMRAAAAAGGGGGFDALPTHTGGGGGGGSSSRPGGLLGARTYRQAVWADLAWEGTSQGRRQLAVELRSGGAAHLHTSDSRGARDGAADGLLGHTYESQSHGHTYDESDDERVDQDLHAGGLQDLNRQNSAESRQQGGGGGEGCQHQLWQVLCEELTLGSCHEWAGLPGWRRRIRHTTFTALLPVYAALRLTIPQVDPETYSQQWLVATMLCSPLAVVVYFEALSVTAIITAMVVGACMAAVMHVLTRDECEMPTLDLGTKIAFGPAAVSLMGFFLGVLWIDTLASEVVGAVTLLSGLLRLPSSLVGLTLLAWGNSLGDFFGNQAMARRGASSTALTACFAAPLFNMLLSMALGFSAYFAKEGTHRAEVSLPKDAALGCVTLVIYNMVLAGVGLMNNNFLPEKFYMFARAWYGLYLIAAAIIAVASA